MPFILHVQCMSLNWRRKPKTLEETPEPLGRTCRQDKGDNRTPNHKATMLSILSFIYLAYCIHLYIYCCFQQLCTIRYYSSISSFEIPHLLIDREKQRFSVTVNIYIYIDNENKFIYLFFFPISPDLFYQHNPTI